MPDIRNCKRCGKIFNYIGGAMLCPQCRQDDEVDFKKVKEYLYEYPGAALTQVSTELGVSIEKIKRFLKDGRLEITNKDGNMLLACENCGKAITTGRFCAECERELAMGLRSAASQMKSELDILAGRSSGQLGKSLSGKAVGIRYLNKEYKKEKEK